MCRMLEVKNMKARKQHKCDWCNEKILPGEVYERSAGVSEDGMYCISLHLECRTAMNLSVDKWREWSGGDNWSFDLGCGKRGVANPDAIFEAEC